MLVLPVYAIGDLPGPCGDVNVDGLVTPADVAAYRVYLADPLGATLPPSAPDRCQVTAGSPSCDLLQVVILARAVASPPLPPGLQPICAAVPRSQFIDAATGGVISTTNSRGDVVTLSVPANALTSSLTITLTTLDAPPTNPIAENVFPGLVLEPHGLSFDPFIDRPARLTIDYATPVASPELTMLHWLLAPDLVVPVPNHQSTATRTQGDLYHFSIQLASQPTAAEIAERPGALRFLIENGGIPDQWGFYDDFAVLTDPTALQSFSGGDIVSHMESTIQRFLAPGIPPSPCGGHHTILGKYLSYVTVLMSDPNLTEFVPRLQILVQDLTARAAELTNQCVEVTPGELWLFPGETIPLSARVTDGTGVLTNCSTPVSWSSGGGGIASVRPATGVVTANNRGTVKITANCESRLGFARVNVVDMTGSWNVSRTADANDCENEGFGQSVGQQITQTLDTLTTSDADCGLLTGTVLKAGPEDPPPYDFFLSQPEPSSEVQECRDFLDNDITRWSLVANPSIPDRGDIWSYVYFTLSDLASGGGCINSTTFEDDEGGCNWCYEFIPADPDFPFVQCSGTTAECEPVLCTLDCSVAGTLLGDEQSISVGIDYAFDFSWERDLSYYQGYVECPPLTICHEGYADTCPATQTYNWIFTDQCTGASSLYGTR